MTESSRSLDVWLAELELRHPKSIDLGLDRVGRVVAAMGLDQKFATVITVGGTNGKGSTVTTLDAILQEDGKRTGRYLSPHLERFNERIAINGVEVGDELLVQAFERVELARGDVSLTYFEFTTIAAIEVFRQQAVDVMLLEVGLGGRLDAVNVLDADVAVVTSIGLDHTDWLGPDRESIGYEKAGIFRAGRAAVCGDREPPSSLLNHARQIGARLIVKGQDFDFGVTSGGWDFRAPEIALAGLPETSIARENATTALAAIASLPWKVSESAIRSGLKSAHIDGRFESHPGPVSLVLDVAHNPHGARFLMQQLQRGKGRVHAVFAMLRDKDIPGTIDECLGRVDTWYPATLAVPRGEQAGVLCRLLLERGGHVAGEFGSVEVAMEQARKQAVAGDTILVFGSFYTVGAARSWWRLQQGKF